MNDNYCQFLQHLIYALINLWTQKCRYDEWPLLSRISCVYYIFKSYLGSKHCH